MPACLRALQPETQLPAPPEYQFIDHESLLPPAVGDSPGSVLEGPGSVSRGGKGAGPFGEPALVPTEDEDLLERRRRTCWHLYPAPRTLLDERRSR